MMMIMMMMSMLMMVVMIIPNQVIDKNGPPKTGGSGIKLLRENMAESKLSYEIMDDAAQVIGMMMMKEAIVE